MKKEKISLEQYFKNQAEEETNESKQEPQILEEIQVEELSIDGICGVY